MLTNTELLRFCAEDVAQLEENLPVLHKALGLILNTLKISLRWHTCDPSTLEEQKKEDQKFKVSRQAADTVNLSTSEAEERGSLRDQGQSGLHREL